MRKTILPAIIISAIVLLIGYFLYCFLTSVEINNLVVDCFLKNDAYVPNYNEKINEEIFDHLRHAIDENKEQGNKRRLSLDLIFGINNIFTDGVIFMKYSLFIRDRNNNYVDAIENVSVKIQIKRFSSGWKIIQFDETP